MLDALRRVGPPACALSWSERDSGASANNLIRGSLDSGRTRGEGRGKSDAVQLARATGIRGSLHGDPSHLFLLPNADLDKRSVGRSRAAPALPDGNLNLHRPRPAVWARGFNGIDFATSRTQRTEGIRRETEHWKFGRRKRKDPLRNLRRGSFNERTPAYREPV